MQMGIEAVGWRRACVMLAIAMVVICAPINLLLARRPQDLGLLADGDTTPIAGAAPLRHIRIVDPAWVAVNWTLARAMRTTRFWLLALGFFGALYAWYAVQVHQTKYLVEVGFSARQAAWALGAVSLAGIPGQITLGVLSDRIGRETVWVIGCTGFMLTYLALLALPQWPTPWLLWAMVLVQGALGYGVTSVLGAVVVEIFEGPHFGAIFGAVMLAGLLGGAAGPFLTGWLHDLTGTYVAAFWLGIGASLMAAVAVTLAAPRRVRAVTAN
jgi:MFS family permease